MDAKIPSGPTFSAAACKNYTISGIGQSNHFGWRKRFVKVKNNDDLHVPAVILRANTTYGLS
ncbi:hypothetical protein ABIB27_003497 [Arthrobacter sp. UYEF21]